MIVLWCFVVPMISFQEVLGHGRLLDPAARSSRWRYDEDAPVNYNDNELFCGGFGVQYNQYDGKCGICGDPFGDGNNGLKPRPHEAGGKYGQGIIVKEYKRGQVLNVVVELTKNHWGHFEFTICPTNHPLKRATEECFQKYKILLADGSGEHYPITTDRNGLFDIQLKLPPDLVCSHCVLRWRYRNGNNWGMCGDGEGQLGCGPQEEFRGCADVNITGSIGPIPPRPRPKPSTNGGVIGLKPSNEIKTPGRVKACAPVTLNASGRRFKETLEWCKGICVNDNPHPICSKLCYCEYV